MQRKLASAITTCIAEAAVQTLLKNMEAVMPTSQALLTPRLLFFLSLMFLDKGFEDAKSVIDVLKGKGFSAIGAAGFCWGAKVVTELAKFEFIQAAVLLHPSCIALDDIEGG